MPTGNLPSEGKKLWEKVYNAAKNDGDDEEKAAKKAWGAVRQAGWKKDAEGTWHKSSITEFSMRIERASYDKATNERRWRSVSSDTDEDSRKDNMSLQLFNDFLGRIESGELVPEQYQSEFWRGGMPYVSVSHYPDLNGYGVPGVIDAVYVDGTYLKAKGRFHDNPLGRRCFEAICADLYGAKSEAQRDQRVRVSIGFLDWAHQHKSNGFIFNRESEHDICPECLKEMLTGESEGKVFLKGHLVHLALTRVPANKRTTMEVDNSMAEEIKTRKDDATSIVGEDLATELEDNVKKIMDKTESLVTFSEVAKAGDSETEQPETEQPETEEIITESVNETSPSEEQPQESKSEPAEQLESVLLDEIRQIKALIVGYNSKPTHQLDSIFETFKSEFDSAVNSDLDIDNRLHAIQEPFNKLGSEIVASIHSSVVVKSESENATDNDMETLIAKAVAKVVDPLNQKIAILSDQLQSVSSEKKVPERRSIQPAEVQKLSTTSTIKSETPKLRALINKTVG